MAQTVALERRVITSAIATLNYQDQTYLEHGISFDALVSAANAQGTKYFRKQLEDIVNKELKSGSLIKLKNGNLVLGPADHDGDSSDSIKLEYSADSSNIKITSSANSSCSSSPKRMRGRPKKRGGGSSSNGLSGSTSRNAAVRVSERRKRAKKFFDSSDNNVPNKRKRGRPAGSLNKSTIKKRLISAGRQKYHLQLPKKGCSMFTIRNPVSVCMRIKQATPLKFQTRPTSLFHRGVRFFLKKNLFLTNSVTSGICMLLGDCIQQEIEFQKKILSKRYDWNRAGRMFTVGMLMGPLHHFYYIYLDKVLPKANLKTVLIKILCDQACASPLTILTFFYAMGFLEEKSYPEITSEVKKKFLYTYVGDCMYWPPVQFFNFYFLSTQYRVIYINVATMVFNIFLSFVKHYDQKH